MGKRSPKTVNIWVQGSPESLLALSLPTRPSPVTCLHTQLTSPWQVQRKFSYSFARPFDVLRRQSSECKRYFREARTKSGFGGNYKRCLKFPLHFYYYYVLLLLFLLFVLLFSFIVSFCFPAPARAQSWKAISHSIGIHLRHKRDQMNLM